MPHKWQVWRGRIKAAEGEYQATRLALDLLNGATPDELFDLAAERGWGQPAPTDIYATERNLAATYLIRIYSVFERAVGSYWRQIAGNAGRSVDGDVLFDEVGLALFMDEGLVQAAQEVRGHRNNLVHRRIEDHAAAMTVEAASQDLLRYLDRLPNAWS